MNRIIEIAFMIICNCNYVMWNEVKHFMEKYPHATFREVQIGTGASTSCGRCALTLKKAMAKIKEDLPIDDQLRLPL